MFVVGLVLQQVIRTAVIERNKEYELAIHIQDSDTFVYGMNTNIGNAFVYGDLVAVDPVSHDNLKGEWLWIQRITEHYTLHYRTVTVKEGKQTKTVQEPYYTWDKVATDTWHSKKVTFLGVEFPYEKISGFYTKNIKTDIHGHIRYKWSAGDVKHTGTIYAMLKDNTISNTRFYESMTSWQAREACIMNVTLYVVLFWIVWILTTAALCFGFCYLENDWLE